MSMLLKTWTPDEVQKAKDPSRAFCGYLQQAVGIPYPTGKDIAQVRKKANEFFALYPHTDWRTLCRVGNWCRARKRRPPRAWMVIDSYRSAWAAGYIPELNQTERRDEDLEASIGKVLQVEQRESWRRRFVMANSPESKRNTLAAWQAENPQQP